MMLRTTLFTALGVSVLAMSAHAQSRVPYSTTYVQVQAQADPEATGAITSESPSATGVVPSGSVPGYNDPYARDPYSRQQAVQSAPIAPPAGVQGQGQTQGYVQPGYGYQPGAQQAAAPSNQPMAITPPGATGSVPAQQPAANYGAQPGYQQGGYQQAQPSYQQQPNYQQQPVYQQQPGYAAAQPAEPPPAGGYAGSYQQDQLLQQARAGQAAVAPAPQGVSYAPGGAVREAAPAGGSYASNAPVVPGTTQAPSGPRIENVDPSEPVDARFRRQTVDYVTTQPAGTIVIDTSNTYLYYVLGNGKAMRYGIGVGREGFTWQGTERVTRKAEWADWRPPPEMIERQPYLPRFMAGGPGNPLGARTMYLGSTIYRIHGTNEPQTIGKFVSSGCIRMLNDDVEDLYERVKVGTKVVILPKTTSQSASAQPASPTAQR